MDKLITISCAVLFLALLALAGYSTVQPRLNTVTIHKTQDRVSFPPCPNGEGR